MPRIAVLSDIHGNLEALEAVLRHAKAEGVAGLVQLGDLVGYNANPRECLLLVREEGMQSVLGNHDLAVLEPALAESFNVLAYEALQYSAERLTDGDRQYLKSLPRNRVLLSSYLLCHGTPENAESYILHAFQAKRVFNLLQRKYPGIRVCFFGHTHLQKVWIKDERGKVFSPPAIPPGFSIEDGKHYLINPGSVGQPRQKNNHAHYLIFDSDAEVITFKTAPYDIRKAQRKIREAGLPEYLARRLAEGV